VREKQIDGNDENEIRYFLAENQLIDGDLDIGTQGQAKRYVDKVTFNFLASRIFSSSRSASDSIGIG
jgi:hypothetical protein